MHGEWAPHGGLRGETDSQLAHTDATRQEGCEDRRRQASLAQAEALTARQDPVAACRGSLSATTANQTTYQSAQNIAATPAICNGRKTSRLKTGTFAAGSCVGDCVASAAILRTPHSFSFAYPPVDPVPSSQCPRTVNIGAASSCGDLRRATWIPIPRIIAGLRRRRSSSPSGRRWLSLRHFETSKERRLWLSSPCLKEPSSTHGDFLPTFWSSSGQSTRARRCSPPSS